MKSTYQKFSFLLFAFLFTTINVTAQDGTYYTTSDLELWSAAKFKLKPNKDWSLNLEHQYRFKDNISLMDQYFTELGVYRKLGKQFSFGLAGRFIRNNDTEGNIQGMENHFRWNADLGYKTKIERLTLSSRFRYQNKKELSTDDLATKTIRLKAEIEYNIKKWKLDPEFSTEIFNKTNSSEYLDKIRFTVATAYKMKNIGQIVGYYRIEKELISLYPKTSYILGIKYQYTFKMKKK